MLHSCWTDHYSQSQSVAQRQGPLMTSLTPISNLLLLAATLSERISKKAGNWRQVMEREYRIRVIIDGHGVYCSYRFCDIWLLSFASVITTSHASSTNLQDKSGLFKDNWINCLIQLASPSKEIEELRRPQKQIWKEQVWNTKSNLPLGSVSWHNVFDYTLLASKRSRKEEQNKTMRQDHTDSHCNMSRP